MSYIGQYFADNNNLYIYKYSKLLKYNFTETESEELTSVPNYSLVNISNGIMYCWNGDDEKFYKTNLSSGKTEKMNISVDSESCDIMDMLPISISEISPTLIIVSDDYIVFYDTSAEAFRVIEKNN